MIMLNKTVPGFYVSQYVNDDGTLGCARMICHESHHAMHMHGLMVLVKPLWAAYRVCRECEGIEP